MENNNSILQSITFPENPLYNFPSKTIDLTSLNEYQKKIVIESQKMYVSKEYIYIYGGGHQQNIETNYCLKITKENMKTAGVQIEKNKFSYNMNPKFYDDLNWENNNYYNGLDCSGFIYACYNKAGINIHCSLAAHYPLNPHFKVINEEDLKAGDIVSYKGHVIIYLDREKINGEDKYLCIHLSCSGTFLRTDYCNVKGGIPLTYIENKKNFDYYSFLDILSFDLTKNISNFQGFSYLKDGFSLFKRYFEILFKQENANGFLNILFNCFIPLINAILLSSCVELNDDECESNKNLLNIIKSEEWINRIKSVVVEKEEFLVKKLKDIQQLIDEKKGEQTFYQVSNIVNIVFR
jgi:hypothetical protein